MRKIYVLDTNLFLNDPNTIYSFGDNEIVIPAIVLEEVDSKKRFMDEIGRNARQFSRMLDKFREIGKLHDGIPLENGGTLRVSLDYLSQDEMIKYFGESTNDNKILSVALKLQKENENSVIVVSKDAIVRIKADALGLIAEDFQQDKVLNSNDESYKGYTELDVDSETIDSFYDKRRKSNRTPLEVPDNHFFILKNGRQSALAINKDGQLEKLHNYNENDLVWGLQSKNVQQRMALELLLNNDIPLVTLTGKAGTGKTLLALAAGLHLIEDEHVYKKLLVARPIVPLGKDLGFLPGEKEEKLRPWMQPIYDNLEFLFDTKKAGDLDKILAGMGSIQIEALAYIRGRSIPEQYIIIDEAQNLTKHEVKTILTRVGEGSKIVLVGDPDQIDHPYLDAYSNGLTYVIEVMKQLKQSGHVTLKKGERSTLAQLCADML